MITQADLSGAICISVMVAKGYSVRAIRAGMAQVYPELPEAKVETLIRAARQTVKRLDAP